MASNDRDPNHVPGLIVAKNTDNTTPLNPTGRVLTNSVPVDVSLVDSSGNQVIPSAGVINTIKTGQVKIAVTGTAVVFPTNTLTNGLIITAYSGNAARITIGGSSVNNTIDGTGNGVVLDQGGSVSVAVSNSNICYINGTAGDWCSFIGN